MNAEEKREQKNEEAVITRGAIPVVNALLIVNAIAFVALLGDPYAGLKSLALWPMGGEVAVDLPPGASAGEFQVWQLVTYAFMHGGLVHLFINMFVLWMFGGAMERAWGSLTFASFYFVSIIGAGLVQVFLASSGVMPAAPTVGASGGIFAILLAFGMTFPNQIVMLVIPPIPMKAKYFVVLIGVIELVAGVSGTQQGVANFAHLAGMIFGLIFLLTVRPEVRRQ